MAIQDNHASAKTRTPEQVAALARSSSPRRPGQRAPLPIKTHHGHVLVRPSVLKTLPYSEVMIIGEDVAFVRRAIAAGYRAVHTEEELSAYSHGSTISEQPGDRHRFASAAAR